MEIIYEDNHLIAVQKPFCMLSQGDSSGDLSVQNWVKDYVKEKYNKPGAVYIGIVHRLDRPVGGVMLLARTSKGASRLTESFKARKVEKTYLAITDGIPAKREGRLTHFLKKLPNKNIVRAYDKEVPDSQKAVLEYTVLATSGKRALIEVRPHTGRRHQIRVQLATLGVVIRGDVKYGQTTFNPDKSICLYAREIEFPHPVKEKGMVKLTAPYPASKVWDDFRGKIS